MFIDLLVSIVAAFIIVFLFALLFLILRADKSKIKEYKFMQGSLENIFSGVMANPPPQPNGVAMHGLDWTSKKGYTAASRLSKEALRDVYFSR